MMRQIFLVAAALLLVSTASQSAKAASCPPPFDELIRNGAYGVADLQGNIVEGCNLDVPHVPASILKVPTALAALAVLGLDYRFKTRFHADEQDSLYIQGFGDPMLTSEEIRSILVELRLRGLRRISSIYIDGSSFALECQSPGSEFSANPYDAPVGPVSVNFNSVPIRVGKDGLAASGELHTPLLPIMTKLAAGQKPGCFRVNICQAGCDADREMARYAAELFRAIQLEAGIPGQGEEGIRPVPQTARLLYEHRSSRTLQELTASFLKYSSNFIANLVYLAIGAERFGHPATWSKANRAVRLELERQLGSRTAAAIVQGDGSGLSRSNQVTARAMLEVLGKFRPHAGLMRRHGGVPSKSGSMKGIWNYAGYLEDGRPYVILLNQPANRRDAVLDLLQERFSGKKRSVRNVAKKRRRTR